MLTTLKTKQANFEAKVAIFPVLLLLSLLFPIVAVGQGEVTTKKLEVSGSGPGFTRLAPEVTGIFFTNSVAEERSLTNRNLLSGSGVAAGDVDGDGRVDLYFCGLDSANVLYRNLGNWKFEDITEAAGVACRGDDSTGAALVDVDGDGDLDLLVNGLGSGTRLFLNDGKGKFSERTEAAGLKSRAGSMSMALADIDGDGDLDLYVSNFRPTTLKDLPNTTFRVEYQNNRPVITHVNGRSTIAPDLTNRFVLAPSGTVLEMGEADALWLNQGNGTFKLVPFTGGTFLDEDGKPLTSAPMDWGLAVQFYDFTGDLAPDIYVCNDLYTPDRIWVNEGKGTFRAIDRLALRNTSTFSMGVDFGDLDRDGDVDFFVVDMLSREHSKRQVQVGESSPIHNPVGLIDNRPQHPQNTLQMNRGDGTFAEVSRYAGVEASEWSWGPLFMDVDLDGYEDIIVSNGQARDYQNADIARRVEEIKAKKQLNLEEIRKLFKMFPGLYSHKILFRNRGDLTFEEVGKEWGFETPGISQGMALADLDNDGDLDLIINNLEQVAGVYRNNAGRERIAVRLRGEGKNSRGTGAKIYLHGGGMVQQQEMLSGGRYVSADDHMRVFAVPSGGGPMRLEVVWRDGRKSVVEGVQANQIYEIWQAGAQPGGGAVQELSDPLFEDVSELLKHQHVEEPFEDFQRQPLLPMRLSQLGPGVAWHDFNGDRWEDLVIASGRSGRVAVYQNDGGKGFIPVSEPFLQRQAARDQTTVIGLENVLLVGSSNYEDGMTNGGWVRIYDLGRKASGESVLGPEASTGPMATGDINGDGILDLFIGGRTKAGRYPEAATSLLLVNEGNRFVPAQRLEGVGLVSGAVLSDIDGDGDLDLLLACHWGPIQIFRNEKGKFQEVTKEYGLESMRGFWNGIATGDFDGDGRLDIVVSNWGLNTRFAASREQPLKMYYGDLMGSGGVDLIEARFEGEIGDEVFLRNFNLVGMAFPFLREAVPSFEAYGKSSIKDLFGERLKQAKVVEVTELRSMLLLNRGSRFEERPLPLEAQISPGFAVCVADFDGDGNEDVFLSQNFFATNPEMVRSDAGRGLLLQGNGRGELKGVAGQQSGIKVYGEQRGAAVADFDGDGRVDLVVTQNGAETKLFHNRKGKAGVRVRLEGGLGNPQGVGAKLRVKRGGELGPVREVQSGSGYWSQNSAMQILAAGEGGELIVQWPHGNWTTNTMPGGALEVLVSPDGIKQSK